MKILTKYLLKTLLGPLFYCLLGFSLLFIISDLFDNFSDFLGSDIGFVHIVHYYGLLLPPAMVLILPACLLVAMLYSLSRLTRHSEIIAMRAGGISMFRIILPFVGVGVVATLVCAYLNENVAPKVGYRTEQFRNYYTLGEFDGAYLAMNIGLKDSKNDWYIQYMDTRDCSMSGVRLEQPLPDGGRVKYEAGNAFWADGSWWFTDVTVQHYDENDDLAGAPELVYQKEMIGVEETPETFLTEVKMKLGTQNLSSSEILNYLRGRKDISTSLRDRLQVDFHAKLAAPFICMIVTLIGVPVGAHTGRRGAFAGIMTAMVLFFVFYALNMVLQYFAKQGDIPPAVGGWLTIVLFGIGAPFMIYRMR